MNVIGGSLKGKRLIAVKHKWLRPTRQIVKKSLFDTIDVRGLSFLDLYSGTGSIGIESYSRGASVTMVDCDKDAIRIITKNVAICNLVGYVDIEQKTVEQFLDTSKKIFDIVFIDPPYNISTEKLDNVIKKAGKVMKDIKEGIIILEYSKPYTNQSAETIKSRMFGNTVLNFLRLK